MIYFCCRSLVSLCVAALTAGVIFAETPSLPRQMTWSAYGTTSTGYVQAIAVSNTLRKFYGTSIRIIPGKNDVSRIIPMTKKRADLCACGISESYFAQEGILLFGKPNWGPQPMRVLFTNRGDGIGHSLVIAGDLGIKTLADLRGKRVAWVRGSPALQRNATGVLAFANLTWDDVERVDVPGYRQGLDALLNNSVDATWASTTASHVQRLAASPRGIFWPTFPATDKDAWSRLLRFAPQFSPTMVNLGSSLADNSTGQVPFPGLGAPYPAHVTYDFLSDDTAYALTKAVMSHHKDFANAAPAMESYAPDRQNFQLIVPYHPGAIKYFREKGLWTPDHDAHNDMLIRRQQVLAHAWKTFKQRDLDEDAFESEWPTHREQHLGAAGFTTDVTRGAQEKTQ